MCIAKKEKKNSNCESFKSVFIAIVKVKLYSNDFFFNSYIVRLYKIPAIQVT